VTVANYLILMRVAGCRSILLKEDHNLEILEYFFKVSERWHSVNRKGAKVVAMTSLGDWQLE
jgi:hypothetical protein